jgi:hypothetical protein
MIFRNIRIFTRYLRHEVGLGFVIRVTAAILCFAIALVLVFIPGPAFVFWIIGFLLLGFTVRDVVKFVQRYTPGFSDELAEDVINHRWVQWVEKRVAKWSGKKSGES